jgi:hypothetical protein
VPGFSFLRDLLYRESLEPDGVEPNYPSFEITIITDLQEQQLVNRLPPGERERMKNELDQEAARRPGTGFTLTPNPLRMQASRKEIEH